MALRLADAGDRVLAISLDPAHSLRDVLGPAPGFDVLELDAAAEFGAFLREHRGDLTTVADRGTYLDEEDIQALLDLSLPGLDEIAGLLKLGSLASESTYAHVIVDLPPTGHTLRLFDVSATFDQLVRALDLMQAKHRFAVSSLTRRYAEDGIDRFLDELQARCRAAAAALTATETSAFYLVARPEPMVMAETNRLAARLEALGAPIAALIVNAASTLEPREVPRELRELPCVRVPHLAQPPVGTDGLRAVLQGQVTRVPPRSCSLEDGGSLRPLLARPARLTIFGGKGGVGKTTMAAATAIGLARREPGRSVVLLSIDPAHSLGDAFGQRFGPEAATVKGVRNLQAIEPDPKRQWAELREHWAGGAQELFGGASGSRWDPVYDRQIGEQLAQVEPTGLDELAGATTVIDLLDADTQRLVVVDSAPTGHLLRFLESPALVVEWSRQLMHLLLKYDLASQVRDLSEELLALSRKAKRLQGLLREEDTCELVVVTLPEPAVLAETERLIGRLRALALPVRHVVLNQVASADDVDSVRQRWPAIELLRVTRRERPIQGTADLEALTN